MARAWQRSLTAAVKHRAPPPSPDESALSDEPVLHGERPWAEFDLVRDRQSFFDSPGRLLNHLIDD